jgi:hypothetical protein
VAHRGQHCRRARQLVLILGLATLGWPASAGAAGDDIVAGTRLLDAAPSLPVVTSGHRPGPDALYAEPPRVPQLEVTAPFAVPPLLVSGTEAYHGGEYLYQDYLYDDFGAQSSPLDPVQQNPSNDTTMLGLSADALAYNAGQMTYPTDPVYANNAADLVELRLKPTGSGTVVRWTLNTLQRSDTSIMTLALDTDRNAATGTSTLPRDPGAPFPGTDLVVTTWGTGAEVSTFSAAGVLQRTTAIPVNADLVRKQLTLTIPGRLSGTVRATTAVGLYDRVSGGWLRPGSQATLTTPGGAGPLDPQPSGIVNLGFRFTEPVQHQNTPPDTAQAAALRAHTPTTFAHDIDLDALRAGAQRSTIPATGLQIRIFGSHQDLGVGRDPSGYPEMKGNLQPYSLWIPPSGATSHPHALTLALHSNGQHHWQYDGTKIFTQLGDERDSVVLSPLGRGRDGWYVGSSELDVFEAWNDAAHHVLLDPRRTASYGYSMGGYGTYRLAGLYPDLFAKAFTVVGPPGKKVWVPPAPPTDGIQTLTNSWLGNVRNIPFFNINMVMDELVPLVGPAAQNVGNPALGIDGFEQLGYRYQWLVYPQGEHYTLAALGYDFPQARDFLGRSDVDRNPAHVTFNYVPGSDDSHRGLVHDHAYWLSDVSVADTSAGPGAKGVVDVRSHGFGTGDPVSSALTPGAGVMALPYTSQGRSWAAAPAEAVAAAGDIQLRNISSVRIDLARARLDAAQPITLTVTADRGATVVLDGISGATATRDGVALALRGRVGGVDLPVTQGTHTYVVRGQVIRGRQQPPVAGGPLTRPHRPTPVVGRAGIPGLASTGWELPAGCLLLLAGAAVSHRRKPSAW